MGSEMCIRDRRPTPLSHSPAVCHTPKTTVIDSDGVLAPKQPVSHSSRQTTSEDRSRREEPNTEITLNGMILPKRPRIRFTTHLQLTEAYNQRIKTADGYMPRIRSCWITEESFRSPFKSQVKNDRCQRKKGPSPVLARINHPTCREPQQRRTSRVDRKQTGLFLAQGRLLFGLNF